jgi:hypothetical protein
MKCSYTAAIVALGHVFTANMTGNVVFLGCVAAGVQGPSVARSGAAVLARPPITASSGVRAFETASMACRATSSKRAEARANDAMRDGWPPAARRSGRLDRLSTRSPDRHDTPLCRDQPDGARHGRISQIVPVAPRRAGGGEPAARKAARGVKAALPRP